jgi:hypothetical protein
LNDYWHFARQFKRHQHVSMLATWAIKAKSLIVKFHLCVFGSEYRLTLLAGKHGQLRFDQEQLA